MFCSSCGKQVEPGARFCPACGNLVAGDPVVMPQRRPLMRPREGRMIAGVCAGFALAYGWDISLVRVVAAVLLCFSGGTASLAYFLLWIIVPEAPYGLPERSSTGTIA